MTRTWTTQLYAMKSGRSGSQNRFSAYDRTQLKLEKGETIIVTKMNSNGLWEGEVNGKKGMFPFTHVKFLEDNSEDGT